MVGIGIVLLFGSALPLFVAGNTFVLPAYFALGVGFLLFIGGTRSYSKWGRRPRSDEVLDQSLSRLNDRYTIIHYPEHGTHSPDHILITPGGVIVMVTRDVGGSVTVSGNRWRKRGALLGNLFNLGAPQLGNPSLEVEAGLDRLEALFDAETLPGELEGVIVFLPDNVEITLEDEEVTVLHVSELLEFTREVGSEVSLSNQDRTEIVDALSKGSEIEVVSGSSTRRKKRIKAT